MQKNYIVVTALSMLGLQSRVNKALERGYRPLGGISRSWGCCAQAMTFPESPAEEGLKFQNR